MTDKAARRQAKLKMLPIEVHSVLAFVSWFLIYLSSPTLNLHCACSENLSNFWTLVWVFRPPSFPRKTSTASSLHVTSLPRLSVFLSSLDCLRFPHMRSPQWRGRRCQPSFVYFVSGYTIETFVNNKVEFNRLGHNSYPSCNSQTNTVGQRTICKTVKLKKKEKKNAETLPLFPAYPLLHICSKMFKIPLLTNFWETIRKWNIVKCKHPWESSKQRLESNFPNQ